MVSIFRGCVMNVLDMFSGECKNVWNGCALLDSPSIICKYAIQSISLDGNISILHFGLKMRPSPCRTVIDSSQPNDFNLLLVVLRDRLAVLPIGLTADMSSLSSGQASEEWIGNASKAIPTLLQWEKYFSVMRNVNWWPHYECHPVMIEQYCLLLIYPAVYSILWSLAVTSMNKFDSDPSLVMCPIQHWNWELSKMSENEFNSNEKSITWYLKCQTFDAQHRKTNCRQCSKLCSSYQWQQILMGLDRSSYIAYVMKQVNIEQNYTYIGCEKTYSRISSNNVWSRIKIFGKSSTRTNLFVLLQSNTDVYRDEWNKNCANLSHWLSDHVTLSLFEPEPWRICSTSTGVIHSLIVYPNSSEITFNVAVLPQPLGPLISKMGAEHLRLFTVAMRNQSSNSPIFFAWIAKSFFDWGAKFSIQFDDLKLVSICWAVGCNNGSLLFNCFGCNGISSTSMVKSMESCEVFFANDRFLVSGSSEKADLNHFFWKSEYTMI